MATSDGITRELAYLNKAHKAIVEARSLNAVCEIRDRAKGASEYFRAAKASMDVQNEAAEVRLRAERRAGEILEEMFPHGGRRKSSCNSGNLKMSDIGIDEHDSSRWRKQAAIPEHVFESHVESVKAAGKELTTASVLKLAKSVADREHFEAHGIEVIDDRKQTELSLSDAIDQLNDAVRAVFVRWPKDCIETAGHKLIALGKEILETGGLRE